MAGNLTERSASNVKIFKAFNTFTLVLDGDKAQNISFASRNNVDYAINNLTIDNSSEEGVALNSTLVTGHIVIKNGKINDAVSIYGSTSFENNTYNGDVQVNNSITLANPLTLNGNLTLDGSTEIYLGKDILVNGNLYGNSKGYSLYLSGHTLEVNGDVIF